MGIEGIENLTGSEEKVAERRERAPQPVHPSESTGLIPLKDEERETDQEEYDRHETEKAVERVEGLRRTAGGDPQ